jgi:hypothetical protein
MREPFNEQRRKKYYQQTIMKKIEIFVMESSQ